MNMEVKSRPLFFVLIFTLIGLLTNGCAEVVGSGRAARIPNVRVSCTTVRCLSNTSANAYVVYTTSSCTNPSFGETVAGSATATCGAVNGCTVTVNQFTGKDGLSASTIPEGTYSVCVTLDFNGSYVGSSEPGDATGALNNASITDGNTTADVSIFSDI
ncbi:MAG: hypothetical protein U1E10_11505 [Bdellovibrionales bacterium]|nr:hypothetical protein [Bdellovibrionales bacterium]